MKGIYKQVSYCFFLLKKIGILLLVGVVFFHVVGIGTPTSHSHEHIGDSHHSHSDGFYSGRIADNIAYQSHHQSTNELTHRSSCGQKNQFPLDKEEHSHPCHHASSPFYPLTQSVIDFGPHEQGVVQGTYPFSFPQDGFLRFPFKPPRVV